MYSRVTISLLHLTLLIALTYQASPGTSTKSPQTINILESQPLAPSTADPISEAFNRTIDLSMLELHGEILPNLSMDNLKLDKRESYLNCTVDNCTEDESANKNDTEAELLAEIMEFIFPRTWMWILIFMHSTVFVVGLVGNALVCVSVYRNHSMRTITNYFITNLAVADFMVLLFCLPPSVVWDVTMTWFFGVVMCKVVLYLQTVSVTVSVLTLTFISIDRWYAICYPLKFKSTTSRAKTAIIVIWVLAFLFDLPELVTYKTAKHENIKIETIYFTQCMPSWSEYADATWAILRVVFLYLIPLLFMTVTYYQIVRVLWKSGNVSHQPLNSTNRSINSFPNANINLEGQLRSRKKAAKMLVAVVVMFAVCYFPVHLVHALRIIIGMKNTDTNRAFALVSHWLCYANSAVNPIIYNFMSGKFRKEFRRAFACCSSSTDHLGYELNSLYSKNTVKECPNGSNYHHRCSRRTTNTNCAADTNFIHRRGTKTSVVKMEV